eukprot:COSAG04_NODE_5844_length_1476_cov_2.288308_1_plen_272_part_00
MHTVAEVFGVELLGVTAPSEERGCIYVPRSGPSTELLLFGAVEEADVRCSSSDAEVLYAKPTVEPSLPVNISPLDDFRLTGGWVWRDQEQQMPAVVRHRFGQGVSLFVAADIGRAYGAAPYPPLRRWLAESIAELSAAPLVRVEAPACVGFSASWHGDSLLLHLVNNPNRFTPFSTGQDPEPTAVVLSDEELVPVHEARLIFAPGLRPTTAVLALHGDVPLAVTGSAEGAALVELPPIVLHEAVRVEGLGQHRRSCEGHPLSQEASNAARL